MTDAANVLSILDYITSAGEPVSGGSIEFYQAGTSTARTVYSDSALSTSLGTIVYTDSEGFPVSTQGGSTRVSIYTGTAAYKVIVKNSAGTTLFTRDNIPGALDTSGFTTTSALPTVPVSAKTAAYTITTSDRGHLFNANPTGGTFVLTLPSAVTAGNNFSVGIRHNGTGNQVTLATVSSQYIRGPGTPTSYFALVGRGEEVWLASDGADWIVTSYTPALIRPGEIPPMLKMADRLTAAPSSPTAGARYIVNGTPTGTWSTLGFAQHDIAEADGNGSWIKYTPATGWMAWIDDEDLVSVFYNGAWTDWSNVTAPQSDDLDVLSLYYDGTGTNTIAAATWTKVPAYTTAKNTITGASHASGAITLPAGNYLVLGFPGLVTTTGTNVARARLYSTTNTTTKITSINWKNTVPVSADIAACPLVIGHLAVASTEVFELQVWSNLSTTIFGAADSSAEAEKFATIEFISIAAQQGPAGAQGAQGTDGLDAGHSFQWSGATTGDPGAGKIRGNNVTFYSSISELAVSKTDALTASVGDVVATWDDSTSSNRATVKISKESAPQNYIALRVSGSGTDHGTYWSFPVTYVGSYGTFAHGEGAAVAVAEKGDKGDTGDPGVTVPDPSGLSTETAPDSVNGSLLYYDGASLKKTALQAFIRETTVTASITAAATHSLQRHNITSGQGTITFGAATGYPTNYATTIINNTTRGWTIAPNGMTSFILYPTQVCRVHRTGSAWSIENNYRWQTRAAQTFYVNHASGSNSNDGLTSGSAFATIQYAIDTIEKTLDCLVNGPTIQVASGTFTESNVVHTKRLMGNHVIYIAGDTTTPSNCHWQVAAGQTGLTCRDWSGVIVAGFKMSQASGTGATLISGSQHGVIDVANFEFGACAGGIHISSVNGGSVGYVTGAAVAITGSAAYHWYIATESALICTGTTQTVSGGLTFTEFCSNTGGSLTLAGNTWTGAGAGSGTTGTKYTRTQAATMILGGETLPGATAGVEYWLPLTSNGPSIGSAGSTFNRVYLGNTGQINFNSDVTIDHSLNQLSFQGASVGYYFDALIGPVTNGGASLGSTSNSWANAYFASSATLDFNNGNVVLTHVNATAELRMTTGSFAVAGKLAVGTTNPTLKLQVYDSANEIGRFLTNQTLGYISMYNTNGANSLILGGSGSTAFFQNTTGTEIEMQVGGGGATAKVRAGELSAGSDLGGKASFISLTGVSDTAIRSTGVGTIKFDDATNRDSAGFIKFYVGTTAYYVPMFAAI